MKNFCLKLVMVLLAAAPFAVSLSSMAQQYGEPAFGLTEGLSSVSMDGAAEYNLPIRITPGVNGMQPSLSLSYSSASGSGFAGAGWTLNGGFQSIHRCPRSFAIDNETAGVTLTTDDALCINGQRLYLESTQGEDQYGLSGTEYRTEIDIYARIEAKGPAGQAATYFRVTEKNGDTYTFGQFVYSDGRIEAQGTSDVRVWALVNVSNRFGSSMRYYYYEDADTGEYYPTKILYTYHWAQPAQYEVALNYEDRPASDRRVSYNNGSKVTRSVRLKSIVNKYNNVDVKRVHLDYENPELSSAKSSRLNKVTECAVKAGVASCLSPLHIEWDREEAGWDPVSPLGQASQGNRYLSLDWDGDGRRDLLSARTTSLQGQAYQAEWDILLGKHNLNSGAPIQTNVQAQTLYEDVFYDYEILDADGDGRSDLLITNRSQDFSPNTIASQLYLSTGDPASPFVLSSWSVDDVPYRAEAIDFDGDGLQDILYIENGNIVARKNSGTGFNTDVTVLAQSYYDPDPYQALTVDYAEIVGVHNFNNDGKPDLRVRVSYYWEFSINDQFEPAEWEEYYYHWALLQSTPTGYEQIWVDEDDYYAELELLDVNGDGLDDLAYKRYSNDVVELNTGSGFTSYVASAATPPDSVSYSVDYNGDGLTDRLFRPTSDNRVLVMVSNGVSFEEAVEVGTAGNNLAFLDIDGDGKSEIVAEVPGVFDESTLAVAQSPGGSEDFEPDLGGWTPGNGPPPTPCELIPTSCSYQRAVSDSALPTAGEYSGQSDNAQSPAPSETVNGNTSLTRSQDTNYFGIHWRRGSHADVVQKVTDGWGNTSEYSYSPIMSSPGYTFDFSLLNSPYQRPSPGGLNIVTSLERNTGTISNGVHDKYSIDYSYKNAAVDVNGRGYLGVGSRSARDSRDGIETVVDKHQYFPLIGKIYHSKRLQPDGTPISTQTIEWEHYAIAPYDNYHVRPDVITDVQFEVGGVLNGQEVQRVETDINYLTADRKGVVSLINKKTTSPFYSGEFIKSTSFMSFSDDLDSWCLGLPDRRLVHEYAPNRPTITTLTSYKYDKVKCTRTEETQNAGDIYSQRSVEYRYDFWGNQNEQILRGIDGFVYSNDEEFSARRYVVEFDNRGQFPLRRITCIGDGEDVGTCTSDSDNLVSSAEWDESIGAVVSQTLENGFSSSLENDAFGRVVGVTDADGSSMTIERGACTSCPSDEAVYKISYIHSDGQRTEQYVDSYGRKVGSSSLDFRGAKIQSEVDFDALGRVKRSSLPYKASDVKYWTEFDYDLVGREILRDEPQDELNPSGSITQSFYEGLTTRIVNPLDQQSKLVMNSLGQVIESYDAQDNLTEFELDARGNATRVKQYNDAYPGENTEISWQIFYDKLDRAVWMIDPDLGEVITGYNPAGEVIYRQKNTIEEKRFYYDDAGRLVERSDSEGSSFFEYVSNPSENGFGQLKYEQGHDGYRSEFEYDPLGRETQNTITIPHDALGGGSVSYQMLRSYNLDKLATMTYPQWDQNEPALTLKYNHDYGQLVSIENNASSGDVYWQLEDTNALGQPVHSIFGNDVHTNRLFDRSNGLLYGVFSGVNGGSEVQDLSYNWDNGRNLISRGDANLDVSEAFEYDELNRLEYSVLSGQENLRLVYDKLGNIRSKSDKGDEYIYGTGVTSSNHAGPHSIASIKNDSNTVATFNYDVHGNRLNGDGRTYEWTSFDKPSRITKGTDWVEFDYGPSYGRYRQLASSNNQIVETHYVPGMERRVYVNSSNAWFKTEYVHKVLLGDGTTLIKTETSENPGLADSDGDGEIDGTDNCRFVANPDQFDSNNDGFGNACDADINNDNIVNVVDLGLLRDMFFSSNPDGDLNNDGTVNIIDLGILRQSMFQAPGPGATQSGGLVASSSEHYLHTDHLTSVSAISGDAGIVVERMSFDPFGKKRAIDWQSDDSQLFNHGDITTTSYSGHEHLSAVGLVHMGGRVYDPDVGKFISPDPTIPYPYNGQSYNRTSYVQNNPLSRVDPTGYTDFGFSFGCYQTIDRSYDDVNSYECAQHETAWWVEALSRHLLGYNPNLWNSFVRMREAEAPEGPDPEEESLWGKIVDGGSRIIAPNLVELGERGVEGSLRDNAAGAAKAGANVGIGLINTAYAYAPGFATMRMIFGMDGPLINELEIDDNQLVGAAAVDVVSNLAVLGVISKGSRAGKIGATARSNSSVVNSAADRGVKALPFPSTARRFFSGDGAVDHFSKHGGSIQSALGRRVYSLKDYLDDANSVIQNGTFVPELNGFVRFVGARGKGNYAFVGLDRGTGSITTFHIKSVKELSKKAPSLGLSP